MEHIVELGIGAWFVLMAWSIYCCRRGRVKSIAREVLVDNGLVKEEPSFIEQLRTISIRHKRQIDEAEKENRYLRRALNAEKGDSKKMISELTKLKKRAEESESKLIALSFVKRVDKRV